MVLATPSTDAASKASREWTCDATKTIVLAMELQPCDTPVLLS